MCEDRNVKGNDISWSYYSFPYCALFQVHIVHIDHVNFHASSNNYLLLHSDYRGNQLLLINDTFLAKYHEFPLRCSSDIYYMDKGILLAPKTLVESIRHYILDPSGVFSVCHAREWYIDKFPPFLLLFFFKMADEFKGL